MIKKKNPPSKSKALSKRVSKKEKGFKIAVFDIETSDLVSNKGVLITAGVKILGEKPILFINKNLGKDGLDDREICVQLRNCLESMDMLVGFYSLNFDVKMINSRLLFWGERIIAPRLHLDLYRLVKKYFNTHRRNLDTIAKYLGIEATKTHVDMSHWNAAKINGNPTAIKYIAEHNLIDLDVTEELFYKVKNLIKSISVA